MRRKLIATMMAAVLSVVLLPTPAFADAPGLVAEGVESNLAAQSSPLKAQAKVRKKATKVMRAKYKVALQNARAGRGPFHKVYASAASSSYWHVYYYALYDVDKNGVPELFVKAGTCAVDTAWYTFTVKSGKLKFLGKFGDGNSMVCKGRGRAVYAVSAHMGAEWAYIGKIKKGSLKSKIAVSDSNEMKGWPKVRKYMKSHKVKSLKISASSYDYTLIDKAKVS